MSWIFPACVCDGHLVHCRSTACYTLLLALLHGMKVAAGKAPVYLLGYWGKRQMSPLRGMEQCLGVGHLTLPSGVEKGEMQ